MTLQPQLHPEKDDIYVVDMSDDQSAVDLAKMYGSTRCYIFVEPTKERGKKAIRLGLENMKQNSQEGALIISDRCVISCTFIANLKKAASHDDWGILFPQVQDMRKRIDPNFSHYCPPTTVVAKLDGDTRLNDAVFYVKSREISDTELAMNYLQDIHAGFFGNELVCVLPEYK